MSWQEKLKPASYNGVPFRVDFAGIEIGWDTKIRETQAKKTGLSGLMKNKGAESPAPNIEIGTKRARTFLIEAHFTGTNYIDNRNAFIAEIERGSVGQLQLPLMELQTVVPSRGRFNFDNKTGGYETVHAFFIETTAKPAPESVEDAKAKGEDLKDNIDASLIETMTDKFNSFVDGSSDLAERLSGDMFDVLGLGDAGDTFSDFVGGLEDLSNNARTIIQTPQRFANQITDTINDLRFAFTNPVDAFNAQLQIMDNFRAGLQTTLNGTESRRLKVRNNIAVAMTVENAALATAGLSAMDAEFDTLDDAIEFRRDFEGRVRTQQARNGEQDGYEQVYRDLSVLLGRVVEYINESARLPSTTDVVLNAEVPALVVVADHYGDAGREAELVRRNRIKHPLFVSGMVEVLSA